MKFLPLILLGFLVNCALAQQRLPNLPEPVTNNAVAAIVGDDGDIWAYSFSGLDSSKTYSGIHKKCFRLNVSNPALGWELLPDLPDGPGRIAAAASVVKDKIYIIGGYEVLPDGSERSLEQVHIFDHESGQFLSNGAPIPVPIDDQVQSVWRDSLIYVITGWSNTGNVPNVQIYNPAEDTWTIGTPVPNNSQYKAFGASGIIAHDTIWYAGGAAGSTFFAANYLRRGVINTDNPTEISWFVIADSRAVGYRSAVARLKGTPYWYGGSKKTYNYDGIAYDGSGPVEPKTENYGYEQGRGWFDFSFYGDTIPVMDSRGFAFLSIEDIQTGLDNIISLGGMQEQQRVTDKCYLWTIAYVKTNDPVEKLKEIAISPNPTEGPVTIETPGNFTVEVLTVDGRTLLFEKGRDRLEINLPSTLQGLLFLKITNERGEIGTRSILKQ